MKTIDLNFMEMVGLMADITGTNLLLQKELISSEGSKGGLLNEKGLTQGAKLDLRFALKKIKEKYDIIEESRLAMLEEARGDQMTIDQNSDACKKFLQEFAEIAKVKHQIEIKPVSIGESNVRSIQSEFDYSDSIEVLFV